MSKRLVSILTSVILVGLVVVALIFVPLDAKTEGVSADDATTSDKSISANDQIGQDGAKVQTAAEDDGSDSDDSDDDSSDSGDDEQAAELRGPQLPIQL